jgi:hypothetical protein
MTVGRGLLFQIEVDELLPVTRLEATDEPLIEQ